MSKKSDKAALVRLIKARRNRIAKERDALQELVDKVEELLEPTDQALFLLNDAIEALSKDA